MNYQHSKPLPTLDSLRQQWPVSVQALSRIQQDRQEIRAILAGTDPRWLMIVGPCSAWPKASVLEYAQRLHTLQPKVCHAMKLVMRVYTQKPRTITGWAGSVNQPDPFKAPDIAEGMRYARDLMSQVIELGLAIADEALWLHNAKANLDLLSWVAIGARSAEDPEHRVFASALECAVGLKNPTHGTLALGVNGVVAAQHPHVTVLDDCQVQTLGNPYAHLVLRGANGKANCSMAHLDEVQRQMAEHAVHNPSVLIDVSHDNCWIRGEKSPSHQPAIVLDLVEQLHHRPDLRPLVKGFMVESFLKAGSQDIAQHDASTIDWEGLSITDPCLDWQATEQLLLTLASETRLYKD